MATYTQRKPVQNQPYDENEGVQDIPPGVASSGSPIPSSKDYYNPDKSDRIIRPAETSTPNTARNLLGVLALIAVALFAIYYFLAGPSPSVSPTTPEASSTTEPAPVTSPPATDSSTAPDPATAPTPAAPTGTTDTAPATPAPAEPTAPATGGSTTPAPADPAPATP